MVRTVGLPREHGGWSLTLEPALLGMLVAWSGAALALSATALFMFTARTPLKYALVDRSRGRRLRRTIIAEQLAAIEGAIIIALVLAAALVSDGPFWWPYLAASPLLATGLWYDIRSKSRRLVPELAGTIGIASTAAAIVVAGGGSTSLALSMWLVASTRSVASVVFVRQQINRARTHPATAWHSDATQLLTTSVLVAGFAVGEVPLAGVIALALAAVFQIVAVRRPVPSIAIIGAQQLAIGLGIVFTTALGVLAP